MKKVYVAHPYSGLEENKQKVEAIVKQLVKQDPDTLYISPIHTTGFYYFDISYEKGMEHCEELLWSCDELLLCDGWENSRGCKLEKAMAESWSMPIRYIGEVLHELDRG
jgi:hypothetical protein